jgi:protein-S-isoprenylcysteine O-methyltransferase Ste14
MAAQNQNPEKDRASSVSIRRMVASLIVIGAVLGGLLFLPAGRIDWWEAWALVIGFLCFLTIYGVWAVRKDPGQLRERSKTGANVKSWDNFILSLYTVLLLVLFPVCGLDAVRFHWSSVPAAVELLGWLVLILAGALILWVVQTNTFASRKARIQDDRGQTVVSSGPYRIVRHPMYLGILFLFLGIPPALGSWFGMIPAALIAGLFIVRTGLEDRMLRMELAGYLDYARKTRFRLFPGIW